MYRQGLGDCFLLSFPKGSGKFVHVMIDCGIVLGTSEPDQVMNRVAEDIKTATGKKLDVLVITHEHWDHLSGFDAKQARSVFDQIQIGQLWLAWTEDEGNAVANQLRDEREKKKEAALAALTELDNRGLAGQAMGMSSLLGFFGERSGGEGDTGLRGTAGALAYVKSKCDPTILETGGKPVAIPGIAGVRTYVLGPPMDTSLLKKANPRKNEGYSLGGGVISLADAFLAALDPHDERAQPFAKSLRKPMSQLAPAMREASEESSRTGIDGYLDEANEWRRIDDAWLAVGEHLALQLDSATNNTSLVLAFEFDESKEVLLFVGDAQAGNWRSWDSHEWTVEDKDGTSRKVTAEDLLRRTVFYKVGHHGSHNATLKDKGLERMISPRLAAVIPVDTAVAHEVKGWKHMPLPGIRTRLKEKCAVVFQSDLNPEKLRDIPGVRWQNSRKKFDVRMKNKTTKKVETVRKQSLYTDYFI